VPDLGAIPAVRNPVGALPGGDLLGQPAHRNLDRL
jgi:hypothetical protein